MSYDEFEHTATLIPKALGLVLGAIRKSSKMTQVEFSKMAGVSQSNVVRWETGGTGIPLPALYKLSHVAGHSLGKVFTLAEEIAHLSAKDLSVIYAPEFTQLELEHSQVVVDRVASSLESIGLPAERTRGFVGKIRRSFPQEFGDPLGAEKDELARKISDHLTKNGIPTGKNFILSNLINFAPQPSKGI